MVNKCECGHAERFHLIDDDRTMCCVQWQSSKTGFIKGCECQEFKEKERLKHKPSETSPLFHGTGGT